MLNGGKLFKFLLWNSYAMNTKIMNAEHEASRLFIKELSNKQIAEICLNTFFLNYNCCYCCSTEDSRVENTSIFLKTFLNL